MSMRWFTFAAVLAALSATFAGAHAMQPPASPGTGNTILAKTRSGPVTGQRDGDLNIYKGIPFAEPPVGSLRWRAPQPVRPWKATLAATAFAPACMQTPNPSMNVPSQPVSEDCLYLNVWSPAAAAKEKLPVIVWIHGGGFSFGSTAMSLFDGAALARKGVVFVSTAYRVGPFGFLAHPELSAESPHHVSGNYGLLDQIAALEWVKANIAAFGGDPARVTIMGESAGSISVSMLAQSPMARGLFNGIIAESGGAFGAAGDPVMTLAAAEKEGQAFAGVVGATTLEALRKMPANALIHSAPTGRFPFSFMSSWPIIDGHVLPDDPVKLYQAGRFSDVPVLMGYNDREGALFPAARSADQFKAYVVGRYGQRGPDILAAYPAENDTQAAASAIDLTTDVMFGVNHYLWMRMQLAHGKSPLFQYHFTHNPPARTGVPSGPIHGAELPYVFDNLSVRNIGWTPADRATAAAMSSYWTNFAKRGDPNGPGLPAWPAMTATDPKSLYFGDGEPMLGPIANVEKMQLLLSLRGKPASK